MTFAALASALSLLASAPGGLVLAQADPAPAAAPASPATDEDPIPSGAPSDDYGLMGWCYGALAGHMGLYDKVLPNVRSIETAFPDSNRSIDEVMKDYAAQHEAGRRLLTSWDRALTLLEARHKAKGTRAAAVAKGREVWKGSASAEPRQLAQLWMSWGLPGRCVSTGAKLAPSAAR